MRAQHLLLLTLVVFSAHDVLAQDTSGETRVIEKIELLGGHAERDESAPGRPVVGISFEGSQCFNDKYIWLLKGFEDLTKLNLSGTRESFDEKRAVHQAGVSATGSIGFRKHGADGQNEPSLFHPSDDEEEEPRMTRIRADKNKRGERPICAYPRPISNDTAR